MTTLRLPMDSVDIDRQQLIAASDWKDGMSHRRYRDAFQPRVFTVRRRGGRGDRAVYVAAFADKTVRDWTPPGAGASIPVQVLGDQLGERPAGPNSFDLELQLMELRPSTD